MSVRLLPCLQYFGNRLNCTIVLTAYKYSILTVNMTFLVVKFKFKDYFMLLNLSGETN